MEKMGKESGEEKDPGQDRKTDGQAYKNKDIFTCLTLF
jgi:hypothetical protein